jgi:hypothetical protein
LTKWYDVIGEIALPATTAKTQLDGAKTSGAAAANDYVVQGAPNVVLSVQPNFTIVTPTAGESEIATLAVESGDPGLGFYEVFAVPVGSGLSTQITPIMDRQMVSTYPANFPIHDGTHLRFYGISQIAPTVATNTMGAKILLSDGGPENGGLFKAQVGGTYAAAGSTTNTGTTANAVKSGASIAVSGFAGSAIKSTYGILILTTLASVKPLSAWYTLVEAGLERVITDYFEPVEGTLTGAISTSSSRLTRGDGQDVGIKSASLTIATTAYIRLAPSTTGNFANGILYQ